MKVGDLVKFDRINGHTRDINDKVAVYLGEAFIHRDDGVYLAVAAEVGGCLSLFRVSLEQ